MRTCGTCGGAGVVTHTVIYDGFGAPIEVDAMTCIHCGGKGRGCVVTPDEERRTHDSTGLAAWLGVLCLLAILVLCVVAIRTSGNWMTP